MEKKSYPKLKTIQKAFNLLEAVGEKQPVKPSELVKEMGMSRSNVHRLLSTLMELGYLHKDSYSRYLISYKMFILGSTVLNSNQITDIVRPYMVRMADISQETVNLAIMHGQSVLYIDKIESTHYLKLDQPIGKTDPLHCTAVGKVLLSGLSDFELEVFLRSKNLVPNTKNTITDREVLMGVIRNVRRQGYALDFEELSYGIHCIGASIRDYTNKVIAAMSISGPTVRLTKERIAELKAPLIEATTDISKKMGCTNLSIPDVD